MPFLTIFTAPKPFTHPHINLIQRNAIQSWKHLGPDVEVLMFGREAGMPEVSAEYNVPHIADIPCSETGTPYINAMMERTRQLSHSPLLCIANADILILPDLLEAARQLSSLAQSFLALGQRWDLDLRQPLDFSDGWVERVQEHIRREGKVHPPLGSDYFIFPRDCFRDTPEFSIGRSGWDNWMIYHAMQTGMHAVDISPTAMVVHQNHDYSHLPGNKPPYHMQESNRNRELAGGKKNLYLILDMKEQLRDGKLAPPPRTFSRALRRLELNLYPAAGNPRGLRRFLIRRLRKMRRDVDNA
jgi:hypothetical protein